MQCAGRPKAIDMLTDYHLHLRPDDLDASTDRYFTPANFERYREALAWERENLDRLLSG